MFGPIDRFPSLQEALDYARTTEREIDYQQRVMKISNSQYHGLLRDLEGWVRQVVIYYHGHAANPGVSMGPVPAKCSRELPVEQTFGEIIAFRIWRVRPKGLLVSAYTDHVWKPGQVMKAHQRVRDREEHLQDKTGVHGWKSVFEVVEYGQAMWKHQNGYSVIQDRYIEPPTLVIGRVKLWGDVVEHERGYRAEFARIVSLDDCQRRGPNEMQWERPSKSRSAEFRVRGIWDGETLARVQAIYFPKKETSHAATK